MLESLSLTWQFEIIHLGYLLPLIMLYKIDQKSFKNYSSQINIFNRDKNGIFDDVDLTIKFPTIRLDPRPSGPINNNLGIFEIFKFYFLTSSRNKESIHSSNPSYDYERRIYETLLLELEIENKLVSSLKMYPELVRQAGHFSSVSEQDS